MNLAVIHYHLNRGGVSRVIENQLRALDAVLEPGDPWRVSIFYGGRRRGWAKELARQLRSIRLALVEVPGLDYDTAVGSSSRGRSGSLDDTLRLAFERQGFVPSQTLVHVHNHALGKNRALPAALARLAEAGFPLLLQVHDFAEDFRPANYAHLLGSHDSPAAQEEAGLYPQSDGIHYATLNSRDRGILAAAGISEKQLHLLPNPVPSLADLPRRDMSRQRLQTRFDVGVGERFLFYPVRCIRRKNVGEALLYAALAPADTVVGLALPPLNPQEIPIYTAWKQCAARLRLPCLFELGGPEGLSFEDNLSAADAIITSSVAEGFGMVFLESWLAGRPLVGRDLPEITADFRRAGLRLDYLQAALRVPLDWVGADGFRQAFCDTYRRVLAAYGRCMPVDIEEAVALKTADGMVDFADLDERMQQIVIERVCRSRQCRSVILEANGRLRQALTIDAASSAAVIEENSRAIGRVYGLEPIGRKLFAIYQQLHGSHCGESKAARCCGLPSAEVILERFLDPQRFRMIRS